MHAFALKFQVITVLSLCFKKNIHFCQKTHALFTAKEYRISQVILVDYMILIKSNIIFSLKKHKFTKNIY